MAADLAQREFGELIERHRAIVFKVAHTYCHQPDDRADLVQEIAAELWRAYPKYDRARSFTTWMYRVALNVAITQLRDDHRRREHAVPLDESLHDVADVDDANLEADQRLPLLHAFIRRQAPLDRALLVLYLDERSQREIGEILGITETNVSTKIARMKQRLRDEL